MREKFSGYLRGLKRKFRASASARRARKILLRSRDRAHPHWEPLCAIANFRVAPQIDQLVERMIEFFDTIEKYFFDRIGNPKEMR